VSKNVPNNAHEYLQRLIDYVRPEVEGELVESDIMLRELEHLSILVAKLEAVRAAAMEYVTDSYCPGPKHDAERFYKLCTALGVEK
jgi:hypothetical protein